MDLRTHLSIVWRWKPVVLIGFLAACLLTFLSIYRVSFAHGFSVQHREGETWQATETWLLYTNGSINQANPPPNNLPGLASLYVQIANSATLRTRVLPEGRPTKKSGDYSAYQVLDQNNNPQPIINFAGTGMSPSRAASVARRASLQFRSYLATQANGIPDSRRVLVKILTPASVHNARVIKSRKLTIPIIVFLAVLIATLGIAYLLENLKPRSAAPKERGRTRRATPQPTQLRERKPASTLSARAESTRQSQRTRSP